MEKKPQALERIRNNVCIKSHVVIRCLRELDGERMEENDEFVRKRDKENV